MEESREFFSDLHYKLLIAFVVLLFLSVIIFYYFSMQYQNVVSTQQRYVLEVVNSIESHTNGQLLALNVTADNTLFKSLSPDELLVHLYGINNILRLKASGIYNTEGSRVISTSPIITYDDIGRTKSFKEVLSGYNAISNRIDFLGINQAYISYRVPLYDTDKRIRGIIAAEEPITAIKEVIEKIFPPREWQYIYVIDNNANFIYHPRLTTIFPEGDAYAQRLNDFFHKTSGVKVTASVLDEYDKLYVYSAISNTNWRVVMATPLTEVYGEMLRQSRDDIIIFVLLLTTIGLLLRSFYLAKRHDTELQTEKLQRLLSVSQLAAGIAHEIRNPLTAIKGFLQLIARKRGQTIPENYFEVMMGEISRIEKLINEFRMLAKPNKDITYREIDYTSIIRDVILLMESQAINKKVKIESNLPDALYVLGDEQRLKQVIINLVRNAIEAVEEQGKVIAKLEHDEQNAILRIIDNGSGIDENVLRRIGTPFFTTKHGGTGLGLSVCYSIIEHHGGSMEVKSEVGQGTEFIVILPLTKKERL